MNTKQLLNKTLYPSAFQNARRKEYPYFDTQTITAGVLEYFFFVTALGNIFARNKRLPLSGSEVFLADGISMFLNTPINTVAQINALNELLQQSYLQVSVDNRIQFKIPGLDFIQYQISLNEDATPEILMSTNQLQIRKLPIPILMNSNSSFEFKFVTTAAAATAFDTIPVRFSLQGVQVDKLDTFYYDSLKNKQFQEVPVSYFDTVPIVNGNETTFQLFANPAQAQNLFSQSFPLSDIQTMQIQNIEVFVNQPDVPIIPETIYNSRLQNILRITIDDVDLYNSNLQECLSVVAGFAGNLTDSAAATTAYVRHLNIRQSKTFRVPLNIPANSRVNVSLTQPAGSLGITGEITAVLRGVETRRVA